MGSKMDQKTIQIITPKNTKKTKQIRTAKKLYIFAKKSRKNIAHGDARGTQRGDIGRVGGMFARKSGRSFGKYTKIVCRGLDRARRELPRGARSAWGGFGAGELRRGWVSHGNISCGERTACGGGAWEDPAGENPT